KDFEAVPAACQQQGVPRLKDAALQVVGGIVVKIDTEAASPDEEDFLRVVHGPGKEIVPVWFNHLADRVVHVGDLLGEIIRSYELDTGFVECAGNDDRDDLPVFYDLLEHGDPSNSSERICACTAREK